MQAALKNLLNGISPQVKYLESASHYWHALSVPQGQNYEVVCFDNLSVGPEIKFAVVKSSRRAGDPEILVADSKLIKKDSVGTLNMKS